MVLLAAAAAAALATGPGPADAAGRPPGHPIAPDSIYSIVLPPALPGAVITATVFIGHPGTTGGSAAYVIAPAPAVRLFVPTRGTLPAGASELPLTFALLRTQVAGPLVAATVNVTWADGRSYRVELLLMVAPVRRIALDATVAGAVEAGQTLRLTCRLRNLGNAPDTIVLLPQLPSGWTLSQAPAAVLAPGDSSQTVLLVRVPGSAPPGGRSLAVRAAGRADTAVTTAFTQVQERYTGGGVRIPATLFVGVPDLGASQVQPQAALTGSGNVAGTRVGLAARYAPQEARVPAFYRFSMGPIALLTLDNARWRGAAGQVTAPMDPTLGFYSLGLGGHVGWNGRFPADVFFARPSEYEGTPLAGHLARVSLGVRSAAGTFSLRGADYSRPLRAGLTSDRVQGAGVTFDSDALPAQKLHVDLGYVRAASDTLVGAGPALDAAYTLTGGGAYLAARLRRTPAATPGAAASNDSYLGGTVPLFASLHLTGWGASTSMPILGGPENRWREAAGGVLASGRVASLQLVGTTSETESSSLVTGGSWTQHSVRGNGALFLGALTFGASGEVGTIERAGATTPLRSADVRASAMKGPLNLWLGADYSQGVFGTMPLLAQWGLSLKAKRLELDGSGSVYLPAHAPARLGDAWSTITVPLAFGAAAVVGAEYRPWLAEGERVRAAAGIRLNFGLPLPVGVPPSAAGIVFDDLNGNGRRDPGEPLLGGVGMRMGDLAATTDERGRFAFPRSAGERRALALDAASLAPGWLVEPFSKRDRRVAVGLVRAGSVHIKLIAEERFGPDVPLRPVPNLAIDLVDAEGRQRSAITDSAGTAAFQALPPGRYTLTVYPVGARGQVLPIKVIPLELGYGASRSIVVPVPTLPVEIRFNTPPVQGPPIIKGTPRDGPPAPGVLGPPIIKGLH